MRNLQEQVKKAFCYQKLFWPFTVWINCSSDLKDFANSRPSASNFKFFSRSLKQFFLTVGQNNFGNKIPFVNWNNNFLFKFKKNQVFKKSFIYFFLKQFLHYIYILNMNHRPFKFGFIKLSSKTIRIWSNCTISGSRLGQNEQKKGLWISKSPKSPISAVFLIVRFPGDQKTALTGESLYFKPCEADNSR